MRLAILLAATACVGLLAAADGVSGKAVSSPEMDPLKATEASLGPNPAGHEPFRYRHGATYSVLPGDTALACEAACGEDGVCQSWSFVAAYGDSDARCELKQGGGKSEENLLATSGVSPRIDASYWGEAPVAEPVSTEVLEGEGDATPDIDGN